MSPIPRKPRSHSGGDSPAGPRGIEGRPRATDRQQTLPPPPHAAAADTPNVASQLRLVPRQQRARGAVDRILLATGQLLDDVGFEGLTTTAVAARAGVNIATLYRYFPDKFAVLQAFAVSLETQRLEMCASLIDDFAQQKDWRGPLGLLLDRTIALRNTRPGAKSLRRALQSSPELWRLDNDISMRLAEVLAGAIVRRRPDLGLATATTVALSALSAVSTLLDLASSGDVDEAAILAETTKLAERYLSGYLD